jgi:hypothetical protein
LVCGKGEREDDGEGGGEGAGREASEGVAADLAVEGQGG